MKIKKKAHPGLVFDGSTGQIVDTAMPIPPPEDVPSIVEAYILLVGKAVAQLSAKSELKASELSAMASVGRSIAMLQAVEEARIHRIGGKAISERTTKELQEALAAQNRALSTEDDEI